MEEQKEEEEDVVQTRLKSVYCFSLCNIIYEQQQEEDEAEEEASN